VPLTATCDLATSTATLTFGGPYFDQVASTSAAIEHLDAVVTNLAFFGWYFIVIVFVVWAFTKFF